MKLLLIIFYTVVAGSYSWGMRGRIIGNQRGAYLPGALLGLIISVFTCNGIFNSLYPLFAAVGAFSMSHGGTQTYGETLSFVLRSDTEGPYKGKSKKGYIAVFIKGADWFGLFSLFIAITIQFLTGKYKSIFYLVIMLFSPLIQVIGRFIFNSPYDKSKSIYPKINFSLTRREEWGGNLLLWLFLTILSILLKDWYIFGAALTGFLSGGLGFAIGLHMFDLNRKDKSLPLLKALNKHNLVGGWKMMECIFGAIAFLGTTLYFYFAPINGIVNYSYNSTWLTDHYVVSLILLIVSFLLGIACEPAGEILNKKYKKLPSEYTFEVIGRVLLTYVPAIIVINSSIKIAALASFLYISYFLTEKTAFEWFKKFKNKQRIAIISCIVFIMTIIHFIIAGFSLNFILTIYTVLHIIPSLYMEFNLNSIRTRKTEKQSIIEKYGPSLLIEPHFILETIILILLPNVMK